MRKAIIIYGPPGGGKGTQSELLVKKCKLINFDTGGYIESVVHDPRNNKSKTIQAERVLFDTGKLNSPTWVLKLVKENVGRIADAGFGVVLSGSPRTMYETFGDKKTEGLLGLLEKKYTRNNILIFELIIPDSNSVSRNGGRLICSLCRSSILGKYYSDMKICPFCGGKLFKRTLDKPAIIKKRLEQYRQRTKPIFEELRKRKFKIIRIDGTPMPSKVFEKISSYIKI